ncbi:benzoate-CoA ligase family protein [Streptomyces sp. NPDC050504]|uniref:benzoate-CoA ligase family protein n=1 Tax=Streptomyces sp. NPDC050504 TaxID=3365618 RepID=UPI0037918E17
MTRAPRNAAGRYLDRHVEGPGAAATADAPALVSEEGELTYRQLYERVCRVARVLVGSGIAPGDRVVTVLPDSPDAVALLLAALRVGAVPVPVSPLLTVEEQHFVITDCAARAVVVESPDGALARGFSGRFPGVLLWSRQHGEGPVPVLPDEARAAAPLAALTDRSPDDPALIQYTSGSTGRPKGVVHLHRGLLAFPGGIGAHLGIGPGDRVLSTAKLPFGYGFGNSLLLPLSVGASAVLFADRSEPHTVADLLRRTRPTLLFAVPTLYAALLSLPGAVERLDFSSVRLAVSAGEHLGAALAERLADAFGLTVVNGLGSTECLHIFMATTPGVSPPGTTGLPVPGFEAEVCDDEGRPLGDGRAGHLRVRGPSTAHRYWERPALTASTFRDGWVHTGDTMLRDPERGWVYLGRSDSILNVGGMKVVPSEIEDVVLPLDGVAACAVVGIPDEDEITRIVAYVVPSADGTGDGTEGADDLKGRVQAAFRTALPFFKRPRIIRVVPALPTTSTGKTARFLIREREREHASLRKPEHASGDAAPQLERAQ